MPALRKTRRIVSSENAKSFMGSEFSYADMSTPAVEDFNYKFLTEQKVDGHDCYVLEIIPKNKTIANENGFSKKISYIDKRIFVVRKATYYNLAGEKEKEMTVSAIAEVDTKNHKYRFKEMTMVNLKNKRKSVLNNNVIKFTPSISDSYFTTRTPVSYTHLGMEGNNPLKDGFVRIKNGTDEWDKDYHFQLSKTPATGIDLSLIHI